MPFSTSLAISSLQGTKTQKDFIQANPPSPPPDDNNDPSQRNPEENLKEHCSSDLKTFCPNISPVWGIYCLYENKSKLSRKCQEYLGSTTLGGCNEDALKLCGNYHTIEDITRCLEDHSTELSTDCLKNIKNNNEQSNRIKEMRQTLQHITRVITIMSGIYLLIPLLFSFWGYYQLYCLYYQQKTILKESKESWKLHSEVIKIVRACELIPVLPQETQSHSETIPGDEESPLEETKEAPQLSQVSSPIGNNERKGKEQWKLSFYSINYWAIERKSWSDPFTIKRKKILNNVSGQFKSSTINAIMGASGCGKTTLLKLLGGQMFQGEFSGTRAINNVVYNKKKYDDVSVILSSSIVHLGLGYEITRLCSPTRQFIINFDCLANINVCCAVKATR